MNNFKKIEKNINIKFKDKNLLQNAFIHRSYINEHKNFKLPSNEKLEFLGDSILSMITSYYLFSHYPQFNEGIYTDIKASIVKTDSLAHAAQQLNLGSFLYLSRGEEENNGRTNSSILADCFEALIAAIFIDNGYLAARKFIEVNLLKLCIDNIINKKLYLPAKNILQEYYQDKYKRLPLYKIHKEFGPQHNKIYIVGVYDNDILIGEGNGKSKKIAEEIAAREALKKLKI